MTRCGNTSIASLVALCPDVKKKIHWRSWEWLSMPKCLGGMGFCELALFNQAMLPKTAWHLLTIPDSLCA
jgi:hypothetical protein